MASKQIDALLRKERQSQRKGAKKQLLLLGAPQAGKSTICKQVRRLKGGVGAAQGVAEGAGELTAILPSPSVTELTKAELTSYKRDIYENLLRTVVILSRGLVAHNGTELFSDDLELKELVNGFSSVKANKNKKDGGDDEEYQHLLMKTLPCSSISVSASSPARLLKKFWEEPLTQAEVAANMKKGSLPENIGYFFEDLPRVLHTAYVPTFDDVLRCVILIPLSIVFFCFLIFFPFQSAQ